MQLSPQLDIHHLQHREIDFAAWDACIKNAANGRIYAYSWYLDIVCQKQWNALVLGNYEQVFPIPYNRKLFGFSQVQRPLLCQQLGLFGNTATPASLAQFIAAIPPQYRYINLSLNGENFTSPINLQQRTNLVLPLTKDTHTAQAYNKSLRKRLRKASAALKLVPTSDYKSIIALYKKEIGPRLDGWNEASYQVIDQLLAAALKKEHALAFQVEQLDNGSLVAGGCFLLSHDRVINVFGASTQEGKALFAMHFLLDQVIQITKHNYGLFDFEGSEIPGIASFFRSFGAIEEPYYQLNIDRLPAWISLLQRLRK